MQGIIYLNNTSEINHDEENEIELNSQNNPDHYIPELPVEAVQLEEDTNLSDSFKKYLRDFKNAVFEEDQKSTNPIYVDEIASRIAKIYESIRRIIDWKEEHLIRRAAIERMLRRRFVSRIYGITIVPDIKPLEVAEPLVQELVRSGHFKNGTISKNKIQVIQAVLERYLDILKNTNINGDSKVGYTKRELKSKLKMKINFYRWILELASCEIEYVLNPPLREYALMDLMTENLFMRIKIFPNGALSKYDKYLQTYIAVRRALFNLDLPMINFDVMRLKHEEFFDDINRTLTANDVLAIWEQITKDLSYSKGSDFFAIAEKYDAAYLLIGDAMNKFRKEQALYENSVSDEDVFLNAIEESYNNRLATLKKRLYRLAIFSTLSIFVAGGFSLIIFEIPIAHLVRGYFSPWAILADLAIPTGLMFLLVSMIKPPSKENLSVVKEEVKKIVYKVNELDVYDIDVRTKKKKFLNLVFASFYMAGGLASLYFIFWVFKLADVPWTSLYIDTINVAMVVFAAMVIKQRAGELSIFERENFFDFILEPFSIPLARLGSWVSDKWKEYNVVSILFTALVDYPFSSFVATLEGWRNFMKEKRSGLH